MNRKWKYGTLDDAIKKDSSNISLNKIKNEDGEYPVFGAKGFVQNVSFFQQEKEYLAIIKDGAGIGRVSKHPEKSSVLATMQYLIPKDGFDIGFIGHFISSIDFEKHRTGSTIPHIYFKDYKSELFPLPPIEEQKRIVAILDKAFAGIDKAIENTAKNLANAKELFESYLNNIFTQKGEGWVENTLKEISIDFGRGKSKHRPRNDPKLYGGQYSFIQTGDVRNSGHFIKDHSQTYSEIGLGQSKLWPKGTLCITIAANIAETGVLAFDACFPDSIIGLVVDDKKYSISFIEYCLQFTKVTLQAAGKGSAQDNINLATFENWKFAFPTYTEQIEKVERLNVFDEQSKNLETIYQHKLTALKELKQSLLQKAFAGELTSDIRRVS